MHLSLAQIDYPASDVERCVQFFEAIFELPVLFRAGPLAFINLRDVRLYVRPSKDLDDLAKASILYFRTEALESTLSTMESKGVRVHERPKLIATLPDHELWMAFVIDPDGRLIGLMEERR
jgi:methylmalonyl-CoA/ethylmalonyl-CoA epimerase